MELILKSRDMLNYSYEIKQYWKFPMMLKCWCWIVWFTIRAFFMKNHLIRNLHVECPRFKELILLKRKSLRNFSMLNVFITANNQELESWFHSFVVQDHMNCTLSMYQMFPRLVSTLLKCKCLYSNDIECAVKIKELFSPDANLWICNEAKIRQSKDPLGIHSARQWPPKGICWVIKLNACDLAILLQQLAI